VAVPKASEAEGFDVFCDGEKIGELLNGKTDCRLYSKPNDSNAFDVICNDELAGELRNGKDGAPGESGQSCRVSEDSAGVYFVMSCGDEPAAKWAKAWCGAIAYNPEAHICESGILITKCGNTLYDPENEFCDTRNDKIYKFANVAKQTWMTENLRYEGVGDCNASGCKYSWEEAKMACPSGWALPSLENWNDLKNDISALRLGSNAILWSITPRAGYSNQASVLETDDNGLPSSGYSLATNKNSARCIKVNQ
jgi:hypothetical protein